MSDDPMQAWCTTAATLIGDAGSSKEAYEKLGGDLDALLKSPAPKEVPADVWATQTAAIEQARKDRMIPADFVLTADPASKGFTADTATRMGQLVKIVEDKRRLLDGLKDRIKKLGVNAIGMDKLKAAVDPAAELAKFEALIKEGQDATKETTKFFDDNALTAAAKTAKPTTAFATASKAVAGAIRQMEFTTARNAMDQYLSLLADYKVDARKMSKLRGDNRDRGRLLTDDQWQELASVMGEFEKAKKTCEDAVKQARSDYAGNRPKLSAIDKQELELKAAVTYWTKTLFESDALDQIYHAGQPDTTNASIAWFGKLEADILAAPPPTQEDRERQAGEAEWLLVVTDIATQHQAYVDSGYNVALRGPFIPGNLKTAYVTANKSKAGSVYSIGGRRFEVGSSDTAGISLKTPIPKAQQTLNAAGKVVASFIYHL